MTGEAYFIGRTAGKIQSPYTGADQIFGGQRLDGETIKKPTYEHCTFANISFKETRLVDGRFLNCVFVACFFRKTDVQSCNFSSCRFIDCEFPRTSFSSCDFRYARFAGCFIPFNEIEHSLPAEPNLRRDLSHNMAREAAMLGDARTARSYRLCEVRAREVHYLAAIKGESKWYRDHYDGFARLAVASQFIGSLVNGKLFGYGEQLRVLIRNYAIATLLFFPFLFYFMSGDLSVPTNQAGVGASQPSIWAILEFSLSNAVAGALSSPIKAVGPAARVVAAVQIVLTAIWVSLIASYVFRWSLRR